MVETKTIQTSFFMMPFFIDFLFEFEFYFSGALKKAMC